MLNYIKSECYRITNTKEIYGITGALLALLAAVHLVLYFFGGRYATSSYSYSNLVSNPMAYAVMGWVMAAVLYEGSMKNGSMKNTLSGGLSRNKIFFGKCTVALFASTVVMAVVIGVWAAAAQSMLSKTGPVQCTDFLMEVPAVYLIAAAGLISAILFQEIFEKNVVGMIVWASVWFLIPKAFLYLAMRFETAYGIALWMPANLFSVNQLHVNTQECITIWDSVGGMQKCVLAGALGTVIFLLLGAVLLQKKEL